MSELLKGKAAKSVMWSAVERFSVQGIQFILTIIIARLVSPSDYGLIAMLGIFLAIAQTFIDSGFSNALIQKQDRTETDFSTVFYFNIIVGVVVYVLLYFCSPFLASFYNEPKLDLVTKVVGLNLIINSFSVVQRAKLTIALNFKLQAVASLIAVVVSGAVGVYMAYVDYGVWAIAFQALLNNLLNTLLLWIIAQWMPKICFSWESFKGLFGFGSKLLIADLLNTIYLNLYSLVIGKRFSATSLGYYNRTSTIAQFPSINISSIVNRALFPILCEVQNDDEKLLDAYKKAICITAYCIFPLMTTISCIAKPFILVVLGEKWLPSSELLQILCLAYFLTPIMILMLQVLNVKGRSDYSLKAEFYKKGSSIILLFITMPFGVKTMCWGLVVYAVFDFLIMSHFLMKVLTNMTIKEHCYIIFPIGLLCVFMSGIILSVTSILIDPLIQVLIGSLTAFTSYLCMSSLFKIKGFALLKKIILK